MSRSAGSRVLLSLAAAVGTVLGAGLIWLASPDVGDPVAPTGPTERPIAPAPTGAPARSGPIAARSVADADPDEPADTDRPTPPPRQVRQPAPRPPIDRAAVQPADERGVATAAAARRPELNDCWADWTAEHGDPGGRFTIELSVRQDGDEQVVAATYPAAVPEVESLDACLTAAFADAAFAPLDGPDLVVRWAVPTPGR